MRPGTRLLRSRPSASPLAGWAALPIVLIVVLFTSSGSVLLTASAVAIYAIAALGLNVLQGAAGIVSLGSAALVGIGAFTDAYLTSQLNVPMLVAMLLAAAAAAAVGLLLSPIAARLKGLYFALATLGLVYVMDYVFTNWTTVTGGIAGIQLSPPAIGALQLGTPRSYFAFVAALLLLVTIITHNVLRSRVGRAMTTLAKSPVTARVLGVAPGRYRTYALLYSSAIAGLAGGALAEFQGYVGYDQFDITISVQLLAIVVIGGIGSVYGVIFGSVIVIGLTELITNSVGVIPFMSANGANGLAPSAVSSFIYGILIIVVITKEPLGFAGVAGRLRESVRLHRSEAKTAHS